ncbi:MAG: SH3 domain-containing protein [bacterium]|nr:SH3 domain-containing protein [bacterium]
MRRAEEALVSVESGLRGRHGRADAVSSLAQARIEVERAAEDAPWRASDMVEARSKLEEADLQIREERFGAAIFFVYRARRMAELVSEEARQVRDVPGARFVRGARVNLRAGPSTDDDIVTVLSPGTPVFPAREEEEWVLVRTSLGPVGWIHGSLLR